MAYNLVPRVLADPESLTPEIRWCLLYLIRGVGYIASRNGVVSKNTNELKTCISRSVSYRRVYACFAMGG